MAKKSKKLTLRQRLRADADKKLEAMVEQACEKVATITEGTSVDFYRLMQLASQPSHSKTLRHDLITALANDAEAELERIYNDQMKLPGVEDE